MVNLEKMAPGSENPSLSQSPLEREREEGSELGGIPESEVIESGVVTNAAGETPFPEGTVIEEWSRSGDIEGQRSAQALSSAQPQTDFISRLDLETECLLLMDQAGKIKLTPQEVTETLRKLKEEKESLIN